MGFARERQGARGACGRTLRAPGPSHCATIHTTHSSGEGIMWLPHRMCRCRSHTLSLNRNGESHLLSEKRLNLVTQAISPRHQQHPEGASRGEGRARASSGTRTGGFQTRFGRVVRCGGSVLIDFLQPDFAPRAPSSGLCVLVAIISNQQVCLH
jgi:hypothetical protein